MNKNYENKIIEAIQMIVNNSLNQANYDKTIQGVISRCIDGSIGKYTVKYQDSSFYAYASNPEILYSSGTPVYVLVPGNDMAQDKTIIGSVDKLGSDYISITEGDSGYEVTGVNCIKNDLEFSLNSYKNKDIKVLYDKTKKIDLLNVDLFGFNEYIQKSDHIICGARFRTNLPEEQKFRGDYGILFTLNFKNNIDEKIVQKQFLVNLDQMIGNPYNLTTATRQYGIFEVNGANYDSLENISLFAYDFPNKKENMLDDIYISKIELSAANMFSKDEISNRVMTLETPQGIYFDQNDLSTSTREAFAKIKIKGQLVNNEVQKVKYYWFIENNKITINEEKYNNLGGIGWECLNNYNVIKGKTSISAPIVEWIPADDHYIFRKDKNIAKENNYKCVALLNDNTTLQKIFTIYNYDFQYNIEIKSDQGAIFYYDLGNPTLTCYINGKEELNSDYQYVWSAIDNQNNLKLLEETFKENQQYNKTLTDYEVLNQKVKDEQILAGAAQENLHIYQNILSEYEHIMRIENNHIYKVNISGIHSFTTYRCSVYYKGIFIGSSNIIISNILDNKEEYSLIIKNGDQVFKYNAEGISPISGAQKNPQKILPLDFILYDNKGREVSLDAIRLKDISWTIPTQNTLIEIPNDYGNPIDKTEDTETYAEYPTLNFTIKPRYDIKAYNNDILLTVKYKEKILTAKTKLVFIKEGMQGTNGSNYICKIVPNVAQDKKPPLIPTYTEVKGGVNFLNFTPQEEGKWFRIQLWKDGNIIYNGTKTGISLEGEEINIEWKFLHNSFYDGTEDDSYFKYDKETDSFTFKDHISNHPANILKGEINYLGHTYYAYLPIAYLYITNAEVKAMIKENSGFQEVLYTSNGINPQWDNTTPFDVEVFRTINGIEENISLLKNSAYAVNFKWEIYGGNYENNTFIPNLKEDKIKNTKVLKNQYFIKPKENFNGYSVNNGLLCRIQDQKNKVDIGRLYIPIHLYLNRFGNETLNGWDGNTIQIKNDDGVILSPQIGAGKKNADNSFTGVFMGSVKETGSKEIETGLFGYNQGERTIALNSEDGSARFGKKGSGQIIFEPDTNSAILRSGNFNLAQKTGMEIDLSKPSIRFGSGKFGVNSEGQMFAAGFATTEYVEEQKRQTDESIANIENSIKNFEIDFNTNSILVPSEVNNLPLETKTYTINFYGRYKGEAVTEILVEQTTPAIRGISIGIKKASLDFSVDKSQAITNISNDFTFVFKYTDTEKDKTYQVTKTVTLTLAKQGVDGKPGPKGDDGSGVNILGSYETLEELQTDHPVGAPGDAYLIQGNLYVWSENNQTWTNVGNIKGPIGDPGKDGLNGKDGAEGKSAYQIWLDQGNIGSEEDYLNSLKGTSGQDGKSSVIAILTNESHVLTAKSNGEIISYNGAETEIKVYDGTVDVTNQCGISRAENEVFGTLTKNKYKINSVVNGIGGTVTFTIIYKNVVLVKMFSVSVSKEGNQGTPGVAGSNGIDGEGIKSISYKYATTTEQIKPNENEITSIVLPTLSPINKFLWQKETIEFTKDTTHPQITITLLGVYGDSGHRGPEGQPGKDGNPGKDGQPGKDGNPGKDGSDGKDGNGIRSVSYYYMTTTSQIQPNQDDSKFNNTLPVLSQTNKYLWQKEVINYTAIGFPSKITVSLLAVYGDKGNQGADGANAKVVTISASAQAFKSTKGANGNFSPDYIYLYPRFQAVKYQKWQYSIDGGFEWRDVQSGQHGLQIGTYNSFAYSLQISKTSDLYSDTNTAITFKCISNYSAVYDTLTIIKVYDVTELEVGGRNLIKETSQSAANMTRIDKYTRFYNGTDSDTYFNIYSYEPFEQNRDYTFSCVVTSENDLSNINHTFLINGAKMISPLAIKQGVCSCTFKITPEIKGSTLLFDDDSRINPIPYQMTKMKLEKGNIATDWNPAPEDLEDKINHDAVAETQVLYAVTDILSPLEIKTWYTEIPAGTGLNKYIWQKIKIKYVGGRTTETNAVCISNAAHYITNVYNEYVYSNSGTVPPKSGWSSIKPQWKPNLYLWVRTATKWSDRPQVEYTTPYCDNDSLSLQNQINGRADAIENGLTDGYVRILHNTIYLMNGTTVEESTEVIRMNNHGIAFAKVPEPGDFKLDKEGEIIDSDPLKPVFTSVWALDGTFDAQSIEVMNLTATNIKNGILRLYDTEQSDTDGKVLIFKGNPPGVPDPKDDNNAIVTVSSKGIQVKMDNGSSFEVGTEKGIEIINSGGEIIFSISKEGQFVEMTKTKILTQLDFGNNLRALVMDKGNHRGVGFIKI